MVFTGQGVAQNNVEQFRAEVLSDAGVVRSNIMAKFGKHDLAGLFTNTGRQTFGFIGEEYQRFSIVFLSVIRNPESEFQYMVYGRNRVKDNVCEFQGTFNVTEIYLFNDEDSPEIEKGIIMGNYLLYENPNQKHVGIFRGSFMSRWYKDSVGNIRYDDLASVADGFSNNQFVGSWTAYSGRATRPCHWGDHRIPLSGPLDTGTAEFFPAEEFHAFGWRNYVDAWGGGSSIQQEARKKEEEHWWK
jgi:hypothetical protein